MTDSIVTTPKTFCFVLMPFTEEFEDVYKIGIKEACAKAGAYCERVDEQIFNESILERIYNQIAKADLIIADMTGRNPNVFYEVGYAHALGKLTILLTKNADDIPFDLKHFPHIVYGTKISTLRDELEKRVKYFIENPPNNPSEFKLGLDLYLNDENLSLGKSNYNFDSGIGKQNTITVHNSSSETFETGDFKIGIITHKLKNCSDRRSLSASRVKTVELPRGGYLHMLPDFSTLFPNAYNSVKIYFYNEDKYVNEETIYIRLFTKQGSRDFSISTK